MCVFVYIVITYLMTAQPLESFRLGFVLSIALMLSLVSQTIGIIFGAAFGVKVSNVSIIINCSYIKNYFQFEIVSFFFLTDRFTYVSHCIGTDFDVLWIFRTFIRCITQPALAISYIVFKICT